MISSDHFSVDSTLIEAWASIKSFRRKDGGDDDPEGPGRNATRDFHKEKRSNETHRARLIAKRGSTRRATVSPPGFAISATP